MIRLELSVELCYEVLDAEGADLVFNVQAARTPCQTVESERLVLTPTARTAEATDAATASRFLRVRAAQGPLRLKYDAVVQMHHHHAEPDTLVEVPIQGLPLEVMPYVYPSRYCQSDRLLRLANDEFGQLVPGYSRVLAIQHWVQKLLTFQSNSSDFTTSAVDTLIERVGVCRDFTHLMIALCRALNIPARIVSGTDYGASPALGPPDFHAYAEVYLSDRWYLFDPSGTGVPMGFVRLGTGRDAADVAFATLFGGITAEPPRISARALDGDGAEMPRHVREALSTSEASPQAANGRVPFDAVTRPGSIGPGPVRLFPH